MSDALYTLGSTLAQLGLSQATVERLLREKLASSDENRKKNLEGSRQNSSDRGTLHSSIALKNQADTNLNSDREVASMQGAANDDFSRIAGQRLDAQASYDQSIARQQAADAAAQDAIKPSFNPADPHNWAGIAAEQAAAGTPAFVPPVPGGTPEDPYNWQGIAAEQAANRTPIPANPVRPFSPPRPTAPQRPVAPVRPYSPPRRTAAAPKPGKVTRF